MFGIHNYASFVLAILVFQLTPGAGTVAILNATARKGIGAGLGAVLGTLCGDFAYMSAAVAGLAAVMRANPGLFEVLQWLGAAYLCWMGVQIMRTPAGNSGDTTEPQRSGWMYFRQAFAVSLTNPKVMLFFVAFFPLFLRPDSSSITLAMMMAHVTVISLVYQTVLVLAGNAVARRLSALPSASKMAARLAGATLIGLGIKLAINSR